MQTSAFHQRRLTAIAVGALLTTGLVAGMPTSAQAADGSIASGKDWTISKVAGGYQVTKELDKPLPIVSDAPVLTVDGTSIGLATESASGDSLTVTTTEDLSDASSVEVGWSSGTPKTEPTNSPVTESETPVRSLSKARLRALTSGADGSTPGSYSYLEDDYDFGPQAIALANIGGIRGEMTGRLYLPTTGGARPVVVLLHGRHSSCTVPPGGTAVNNPNRWPCIGAQVAIPSYKGYESTAQTLATQGYAVISISANAINANDNQLASDYGAQARGQLVLDTLTMLKNANAGTSVSYHDAWTNSDVSLDQALQVDTASTDLGSTPTSGTNPGTPITSADLVGRFDLSNVGMMGHSRGGEGVVSAVNLNQALPHPFGIKSVIPLAPVDFGRETVADTDMLVILPYCDGDVSNQQGQHFADDSRYAYDDDSLRSVVWVMGADHNFFNSVWTPGKYSLSTSDDWSPTGSTTKNDTVCSTAMAGNQRLSADDQYNVGVAVMSAWFRLTMGGESQFLPMFDGSTNPALPSVPTATLFTQATAPSTERADIEQFTSTNGRVRLYGSGTANICASAGARTMPQDYQACATANTLRSTSAMPHWTPASFAPNAPASPMTKFVWTSVTGSTAASIRVTVPAAKRNASGFDMLSFKTAPDESVLSGTDMTLTVVDGHGATWTSLVSALNSRAINRLPISGSTTLNKIVLQQVAVPISTLATAIDVTDIREIRIAGATGADATATGGAYLSDLAFSRSATGTTAGISAVPTINVASTNIEEGNGISEAQAAVTLSAPVSKPVSAWFTLIGSTSSSGQAALAVQKVTFAPGETCLPVTFTTYGDTLYSSTATTSYKMDVSAPVGVIVGANQFGWVNIRQDDEQVVAPGATPAALAPAVGAQGDVCAEFAAQSQTFALTASALKPAPGATVTLTGAGYRSGELVTFADGATAIGTAVADASGSVSYDWTIPTDATLGAHDVVATGAGSARRAQTSVSVLAPTETALSIDPSAPAIKVATTLSATVSGADTTGSVEFFDGTTSLGVATAVEGVATLEVPAGFLAGDHSLTAVFGETGTAAGSTSNAIAFTLVKGATTTVVTLSQASTTYGTGATGTVSVGGGSTGEVTVTVGGTPVQLTDGGFTVPASLVPGDYPVVATYGGSDLDEVSTATTTYTVTKAASTTTLTTRARVNAGKPITVKAMVAGVAAGVSPTGAVTIKVGAKQVAVVAVPASGSVVKSINITGSGSRKVTVTYSGDANYSASSASRLVEVVKKPKK